MLAAERWITGSPNRAQGSEKACHPDTNEALQRQMLSHSK